MPPYLSLVALQKKKQNELSTSSNQLLCNNVLALCFALMSVILLSFAFMASTYYTITVNLKCSRFSHASIIFRCLCIQSVVFRLMLPLRTFLGEVFSFELFLYGTGKSELTQFVCVQFCYISRLLDHVMARFLELN